MSQLFLCSLLLLLNIHLRVVLSVDFEESVPFYKAASPAPGVFTLTPPEINLSSEGDNVRFFGDTLNYCLERVAAHSSVAVTFQIFSTLQDEILGNDNGSA